MNWRRVARGGASLLGAAAVLVAVPVVVYLLAAKPLRSEAEDARVAASVARQAEAIAQRGARKGAPPLKLNPNEDRLPAYRRGAATTLEDAILSEYRTWAVSSGLVTVWLNFVAVPPNVVPFFHGRNLDRAKFRKDLTDSVLNGLANDKSANAPAATVTAAFMEMLDEWEAKLLGPEPATPGTEEEEMLCQWAIVRAFHEGNAERARWMLIEYLRLVSRACAAKGGIEEQFRWPMRTRFVLLLADRGLLDSGTLAALEQALETAVLTDEEFDTLHQWATISVLRNFRDTQAEPSPFLLPLRSQARKRMEHALLHGEDFDRPRDDVHLMAVMMSRHGFYSYGGELNFPRPVAPEVRAALPWMVTVRASSQWELNMLRFVLAALRFEQDHGAMPVSDDDLIPGYLSADFREETCSRWIVEVLPATDLDELLGPFSLGDPFGADPIMTGVRTTSDPPGQADGSWSLCVKARPIFVRISANLDAYDSRGRRLEFGRIRSAAARQQLAAAAVLGPEHGNAYAFLLTAPSRWDAMIRALKAFTPPPPAPVLPGT